MLDSLMMQSHALRGVQQNAARILYRVGIRANWATIIGAIFGILSGIMFACGATTLAVSTLALSCGFDAIDGTLAREFETARPWGGILDLTLDRVVEVAILWGLVWRHPSLALPAAVVLGNWYVNIAVCMATGTAIGGNEKLIHYPPGLVERSEALVVSAYQAHICYGYAALEIATAVQRGVYAWRYLAQSSSSTSGAR